MEDVRLEKTIEEYLQELSEERPYKIVLSQPAGKETEFRKVEIRMIESKQGIRYQIEKFTAKQAFHINIEETEWRILCGLLIIGKITKS